MKKFFFAIGALLTLTATNSASAWEWPSLNCDCGQWYLGAFGGYNWTAKNSHRYSATSNVPHRNLHRYKNGYIEGGNVGFAWENGLHLEAEVSYRHNINKRANKHGKHFKTNHQATAFMVNGLYQFHIEFTPLDVFFGGGMGYVNTPHYHNYQRDSKRKGYAWQFIGGVAYPICGLFDVDLTYRYFNEARGKFRNSSVDLGIRYYF